MVAVVERLAEAMSPRSARSREGSPVPPGGSAGAVADAGVVEPSSGGGAGAPKVAPAAGGGAPTKKKKKIATNIRDELLRGSDVNIFDHGFKAAPEELEIEPALETFRKVKDGFNDMKEFYLLPENWTVLKTDGSIDVELVKAKALSLTKFLNGLGISPLT